MALKKVRRGAVAIIRGLVAAAVLAGTVFAQGPADVEREFERATQLHQSGDLQGLSGGASADSESVDELLEEGNAFEAGVVMGVEDVGDADLEEVQTHQVPEDDVPAEYLDND